MKIEIWWIGRTNEKYLKQGIDVYMKRLKHYHNTSINEIKDVKVFTNAEDLKDKEADQVLKQLNNNDFLILLDENGKQYSSLSFSRYMESLFMQSNYRRIIFLIAGAFGAGNVLKTRADLAMSFSKMTFSHQMIRVFLLEQLYRSFTIIRNEKYHNP